ncbi:MAG: glycosyltransferase family 2 protein [Culicoidibacterales bacterium]
MKKLTIVVPCYNIEKYIDSFITNMNQQILPKAEYELIFIDDKSTDNSYSKLQTCIKNKEIDAKVFQLLEKGGAGGARNRGLQEANSKYTMFIDMDDEFSNDFFVEMLDKAEQDQADIVICEYYGITSDNKKIHYKLNDYSEGRRDPFLMGPAPWNKIFRTDFLKNTNIYFQEILRHQDLGTVPKWMYLADKISYVLKPLYFYKIAQPGSITLTTSNFNEDIYKILDDLVIFFESKDPNLGEVLVYNHLVTRHLYYGNHSLKECIKFHRYLMNYVLKKYPNCISSVNLKKMDLVVKLPYYMNYYTKGIFSGILFKFIKKFNLEKFLYKYE